ncbi:tetratricopeptide repeat protein [Streptomyces sp. NPDC048659]|uniref:tetratricopeptide repeat protein n=1 Tax=Streptomyces sp. NPDC048659 TaxID=3155489 RepID=UPI003421173C
MLDTPEAVLEALRENHDRPHGLHRTVTAEELAEAAEPFDKPDMLITALLELMTAYEYTGEHRKSPVVFARLLKLWDTAPESFSDWEAHQVFWRFKWVTTSLLQVPEVPLATVHAWIDRMRSRYEAAGHGMQPVAAMRYHVAVHTGTDVADAYDLWATRGRTRLSDCEACETRHLAWHQVLAGDDAGAVDSWAPVLAGAQSCSEEPQASQARVLLSLLREGRTDEVRSHHLTGYRQVRGGTGTQEEVGLHLEFCALSRNEGRGLEILAENRPLFEATGAPLAHLEFLTGVEVLVARLVEDGHADTVVAGPPGRGWTATGLLAHVRTEADRLAAAFDARNGTTAVGDRRAERLARKPLVDAPLPLGLRSSGAVGTAPKPAPPKSAAVAVPDDFAALVREARRLSADGHPTADRLWTAVEERVAAGTAEHTDDLGPEALLQAECAEHRAAELGNADHDDEAVVEMERAAELYGELGMRWHELSVRTRAVAWGTKLGEQEQEQEQAAERDSATGSGAEGTDSATESATESTTESATDSATGSDESAMWARLDGFLAEAELLKAQAPFSGEHPGAGETGSAEAVGRERVLEYLSVLSGYAFAAYKAVARRHPEAPEAVRRRFDDSVGVLITEAERHAVPHQLANARQYIADLSARNGEFERAEADLREALKLVEAAGRPWRGSRPRALLAQVLMGRGQREEAVELLHQAIADAVRHDETDFPLAPTYSLLGHALSHLGDTAGAVRYMSEAAARFDQADEQEEASETRLRLADVLTRDGRHADAVAVLESVLADERTTGLDEPVLAQARLNLARGLRELEEYLAAATEFLRLADTVAAWEEDRYVHTLVAAEAATTLAMADRWEQADAAYERAVEAHAEAPNPPVIAEMMREFARLTMLAQDAEGVETALAHLTRADALVAAAAAEGKAEFSVWYETGSVHYRRSRVLAEAGRFDEALVEAQAAIDAHEEGGEHGEIPRAEAVRIAALIEGNGLEKFNDAITRLTAAAARCRHAGLDEAAQILDALRQEYLSR